MILACVDILAASSTRFLHMSQWTWPCEDSYHQSHNCYGTRSEYVAEVGAEKGRAWHCPVAIAKDRRLCEIAKDHDCAVLVSVLGGMEKAVQGHCYAGREAM